MPPTLAAGRYAALHLYATNGTTFVSDLPTVRNVQWQDKNSDIGTMSFEIPLADAAGLTDRRIVKASLFGNVVFACVIRTDACTLAVDGTVWVRFENQPGLLSLLGDMTAFPEYGLERNGGTQRHLGFMSKEGPWYVAADWDTPIGFTYQDGITVPSRGRTPSAFAASNPYWISSAGPDVNVSEDDINYFRCPFPTTERKAFEFEVSGDNFLTFYFDGEEILTPDPADPHGWYAPSTPRVSAPADDEHIIAASVANSYYNGGLSSEDHRNNPIALIMTVWELDAAGERKPIPFLQTNLTDWLAHDGDPEPGWFAAQVIRKLIIEGIARADATGRPPNGVQFFDDRIGFTDTQDSDENDWTVRGQYTVDIGTVSLADIVVGLGEKDLDVWVDPDTCFLEALIRRGADNTGTVELTVGEGGNLLEYETTRSGTRWTFVLERLAGDTWYAVDDGDDTVPLVETGLDVGSTSSRTTGQKIGQQLLDESGVPVITVAAKTSTLAGPMPYNGINMGDTILMPGHRGVGTIAARALVFTYNGSGDTPELYADFVEDRTG